MGWGIVVGQHGLSSRRVGGRGSGRVVVGVMGVMMGGSDGVQLSGVGVLAKQSQSRHGVGAVGFRAEEVGMGPQQVQHLIFAAAVRNATRKILLFRPVEMLPSPMH